MFDFDEVVDRKGTNCAKWDTIEANNKPKDVLPMWVADIGLLIKPNCHDVKVGLLLRYNHRDKP